MRERGQGVGILVSKVPKETSASYSLQEPSEVNYFSSIPFVLSVTSHSLFSFFKITLFAFSICHILLFVELCVCVIVLVGHELLAPPGGVEAAVAPSNPIELGEASRYYRFFHLQKSCNFHCVDHGWYHNWWELRVNCEYVQDKVLRCYVIFFYFAL